ncbi:G-protein coupled receptor moody-like [Patiria miniata]|uniref:G-protein coupled receptors family 1 profile domain-containing protein n=1 Tax=Patiria miniata TaxID=46514 RepID=A0A914AEK7_PATMI|nr:G-protein coupled receptor moody-like [Patiria miniata]
MPGSVLRFVDVIHPELKMDNSGNETMSGLPSIVVTRIAAGITTVFTLFGLVGNLLVIAAVARKKNLRTRGNAFIVSLSVVGLLYAGCVLIPGIDTLIYREWRSGDFMCGFHTYYTLAFSLLSLLHTMCIGLDRLVNVVLFTRARKIASRRNIGIAVVLCWLVTAGVMMCYHFFVVAGRMYYLEKALRCIAIYNASSWRVSVVVYCFIFILPSIVIVVSYVTILSFVKKKRKSLHSKMGVATRTIATSVTNGEAMSIAVCSDNTRDKVTFAPVALQEEKEQILQCPRNPSLVTNPENPPEVDTGQADHVGDGKEVDAAGKTGACDENKSTPLAEVHRCSIVDAVYQSSVTINTVDFSPDIQEPSLEGRKGLDLTTTQVLASADRTGEAASGSRSGHGGKAPGRPMTRRTRVRLSSTESDMQSIRSAPSQSDLTRRRGSIWPGHKRLSEVAKTLGRGRDRFKPSRSRNDRDLNRMMLAVFLVVWVGYLPYPLVRYLDIPGIDVSSNVYMVVTVTSYVAGCVNPIIYGFMHRRFRAAFIEMLTLGKCKSNNRVGVRGRDGSVSGTEGSTAVERREEA